MYDLSLLWLYIVTNLLWLYIVTMASLTMAIHTINYQAAAYDLSVSHSVEPAALQSAIGLTAAQASSKYVVR